ncbi:MAG TPA: GNAT family N-acetyltransferase [Candidatus Limnocylindria bacterium]|nr:GNAT family N-acetyltransferase [Candidatus Limnocylindria bacterium]
MESRPVTADDLPACVDTFYAAEDELYRRMNQPLLPRNPEALTRLFGHILETDPERCRLVSDSRGVRGFGMAVGRDELAFLSFLFVRPDVQGQGLGRLLFEQCLLAQDRRATCIEAIQSVSASLYASRGLVPRVPIYTLVGEPGRDLPRLPGGVVLEPFAELAARDHSRLAAEVDALDRSVLGFRRPQDHRAWNTWGRQGFLLRDDKSGAAAGYGYAHNSGRVGPVVTADETLLLPLLGELLRQVAAIGAWQVLVPGPAQQTFVALLSGGLRLEGPPAIYCATDPSIDHARYLPASFALP